MTPRPAGQEGSTDLAEVRDETEQAEVIKDWIRRYGPAVIGGVALGIAGLFGWRGYDSYMTTQAREASAYYQKLTQNLQEDNAQVARSVGEKLIQDYPGTSYASLGALMLGKAALAQGALDEARKRLQWALDNTGSDGIAAIARLRLARVHLQNDDLDKALELVREAPAPSFERVYAELRGDVHSAAGRQQKARRAYADALSGMASDAPARSRVEMKLDDLGGPPS